MESMDDAGVYKISDTIAMVQTVDFLFPIVNDPHDFGQIAAANSLSDIWAMGAKAITAMNVLAYPAGKVPPEAIEQLLIGGSEKLTEAGVSLVGGHTLEQETFIYGMSVTGTVHPDKIISNKNARAGDIIILTKPLGTGVMSSAVSEDGLTDEQYKNYVETMSRLNKYASEVLINYDLSALTDVTGFGLLGHALPIAQNAQVKLSFNSDSIPWFKDIFAIMDTFAPKGLGRTREYVEPFLEIPKSIDMHKSALLSEAQTSGGLLAFIREDQAEEALRKLHDAGDTESAIIGEVCKKDTEDSCFLKVL